MEKRLKYTPDPTRGDAPLVLKDNEVFVFGANQLGEHYGGSARAANEHYGAVWHEIHRTGRSYGIVTIFFPTSTTPASKQPQMTKEELEKEFALFIQQTQLEKEKLFYLTRVGLQRAGWTFDDIVGAFHKFYVPEIHVNIILPGEEWEKEGTTIKSWEITEYPKPKYLNNPDEGMWHYGFNSPTPPQEL